MATLDRLLYEVPLALQPVPTVFHAICTAIALVNELLVPLTRVDMPLVVLTMSRACIGFGLPSHVGVTQGVHHCQARESQSS
jgi:hypothetical protein